MRLILLITAPSTKKRIEYNRITIPRQSITDCRKIGFQVLGDSSNLVSASNNQQGCSPHIMRKSLPQIFQCKLLKKWVDVIAW